MMQYRLEIKTLNSFSKKPYASKRYAIEAFRKAIADINNLEVSVYDQYDHDHRVAHMLWSGAEHLLAADTLGTVGNMKDAIVCPICGGTDMPCPNCP